MESNAWGRLAFHLVLLSADEFGKISCVQSRRIFEVANKRGLIHADPDILGGTPVFAGTRVPIGVLLDYLEAGDTLNEFLDHFPTVTREQAIAVLELAEGLLASHANTP
jgi:uncharacterized protein (DUF433 family)